MDADTSKHILLSLYSNKTIGGGCFGGLLVVEITKKIIPEKTFFGRLGVLPIR